MKSLGRFPDPFLAEIAAQPAAIRRAAERLGDQATALERLRELPEAARHAAVFTGMGASSAACHAPVTLLAGIGAPAAMVDTAELLHFRLGLLHRDSVLVVVSQSGRSAEAVRLVEGLDPADRPTVVAVTNGVDNPLAAAASMALDTAAGPEVGPSTVSFAASVVVLRALAEVLSGRPVPETIELVGRRAGAAARSAEKLLEDPDQAAERFAEWFDDRPVVVLLGRGTARAASEVGALVLKEAARIPAEAMETAQFRHGPLELAGGTLAAAVIATEPATAPLDLALAGELAGAGASVLVVRGGVPGSSEDVVALGDVDRSLAPAVAAVPFQLLAWRVAVERGLRPGILRIASKVTTRE